MTPWPQCARPWAKLLAVLGDFEIRTDVHVVRFPDRYMAPRGEVMWQRVQCLLAKRQQAVVA
jgi:hypothetical protein